MLLFRISASFLAACTLVQSMNSRLDNSGESEFDSPLSKPLLRPNPPKERYVRHDQFQSNPRYIPTSERQHSISRDSVSLAFQQTHKSKSDNLFLYKSPDLQGSIWNTYQDYPYSITEIRLENYANIIQYKNKLTLLILSFVMNFDGAIKEISTQEPLPLQMGPISDFELGLTSEELQRYRFMMSFKQSNFDPSTFSAETFEKASQLFHHSYLGMDVVLLSIEILKLPNQLEQDHLVNQIIFRLASNAFTNEYTKSFWISLDSPQRRNNIERFCNFYPSKDSDLEIISENISFGMNTRAVIIMNKCPDQYFLESVYRIDETIARLQLIRRKVCVQNHQISNFCMNNHTQEILDDKKLSHLPNEKSVTEKNKNTSILNQNLGNEESKIFNKTLVIKLPYRAQAPASLQNSKKKTVNRPENRYAIKNAVSQIEKGINSRKVISLPSIDLESRDSLLKSLDPSIIECLSKAELSDFLVIYNAEVNKLQVIKEFNISSEAVDLIGALKLGDSLTKFSSLVLQLERNNRKIIFKAAGKYLAYLTNIAQLYQSFWMNAAQDKYRIIELKRFEESAFGFETAEAEISAGRRLLNVFKHVKNDTKIGFAVKDINWRMSVHSVILSNPVFPQ